MKRLQQFVNERFVNAPNREEVKKMVQEHGDEIFKIIEYGYRDIGGCAGIEKPEDILSKADFIKLYRKDGEIVAVALYADKRHPNKGSDIYLSNRYKNKGRKIVACAASEGNAEYLKKIFVEDFKQQERNVWGEFSSKMATFALRCGALPIPISAAEAIMDPKKFYEKKEDGFFYTRKIAGKFHTKVMMGNHLFYSHNIDEKMTEEQIQEFKKLAIKYGKEDEELNHM